MHCTPPPLMRPIHASNFITIASIVLEICSGQSTGRRLHAHPDATGDPLIRPVFDGRIKNSIWHTLLATTRLVYHLCTYTANLINQTVERYKAIMTLLFVRSMSQSPLSLYHDPVSIVCACVNSCFENPFFEIIHAILSKLHRNYHVIVFH